MQMICLKDFILDRKKVKVREAEKQMENRIKAWRGQMKIIRPRDEFCSKFIIQFGSHNIVYLSH